MIVSAIFQLLLAHVYFLYPLRQEQLLLFGKREPVKCSLCSMELKHRYKPKEEWGIEGYLCSDCHIEKMKEFASKPKQKQVEEPECCVICKEELGDVAVKPRWQWEMESGTLLCQPCFARKEAEYNKKLNFCATCGAKMGFIRYNPKPAWKLQGQMCRGCWDTRNKQK